MTVTLNHAGLHKTGLRRADLHDADLRGAGAKPRRSQREQHRSPVRACDRFISWRAAITAAAVPSLSRAWFVLYLRLTPAR